MGTHRVCQRRNIALTESAIKELVVLQRSGNRSASEAVRAAISLAAAIERSAKDGFAEVHVRNPQTGAAKVLEVIRL